MKGQATGALDAVLRDMMRSWRVDWYRHSLLWAGEDAPEAAVLRDRLDQWEAGERSFWDREGDAEAALQGMAQSAFARLYVRCPTCGEEYDG